MLAGALLVLHLDLFSLTPWVLALFPGILSVRGAIGGLFSGRLSTALHIGTVRASYTKNTKNFYLLLCAAVTLTLEGSLVVGLAASLFGVLLWGATLTDLFAILTVIVMTMGLSIILISPITIGVSILTFNRGLDPDVIVYPVMATVADVLVTACYVLALNGFFSFAQLGRSLIGLFDITFLSIVLYILIRNAREREFAKTVREFLLTLLLVAFIVNVTGFTLGKISQFVGGRPEIYVVYPVMINTLGSVGSIVGSTATTKLALGTLKPSLSSIRKHVKEIGGAWTASLVMFTLYSLISSLTSGKTTLSNLARFTAQLLTTNVIAVFFTVIAAFTIAVFTHRRGWDPDNFVTPLESSLADGITTISLLMALTVIA